MAISPLPVPHVLEPKRSVHIVLMSKVEGLTFKAIAERLGLKESTTYYEYRRGLRLIGIVDSPKYVSPQEVGLAVQRYHTRYDFRYSRYGTPEWFHEVLAAERSEDDRKATERIYGSIIL